MSNHKGYTRVAKRCRGSKGLRVNIHCRRFSVQGLRARFIYLFRQMSRWRSYFQLIIRRISMNGNSNMAERNNSSGWRSGRSLVMPSEVPLPSSCRLRSPLGRSNSFYSEAIADCLEFIKRSSISDVDQKQPLPVNACQT